MGYKISYENVFQKEPIKNRRILPQKIGVWLVAALVVALCLIGAFGSFDILIPGDAVATKAAAETFTDVLRNGSGIKDAFSSFCNEIIEGASLE